MTLAEKLRKEGFQKGLHLLKKGAIEISVGIKSGGSDGCKSIIAKIKTIRGINFQDHVKCHAKGV